MAMKDDEIRVIQAEIEALRGDDEKFTTEGDLNNKEVHDIDHRIEELRRAIRDAEIELGNTRDARLDIDLQRLLAVKSDRESEHQGARNELDRLEQELAHAKGDNAKTQQTIDEKEAEIQNIDNKLAQQKRSEEQDIENLEQVCDQNKKEAANLDSKINKENDTVKELEIRNRE